jgi:hypothetical protein
MSFVVTKIDMGCGCCSYVPIAEYDRLEDVPDAYCHGGNYEIDHFEDDE